MCRGKLTVATLVPAAAAKPSASPAVLREAVQRAWPVLLAVLREVLPRDTTAEGELLRISVNAFEPAHASSDPIESLVVPVFKEMASKFGRYLASGGIEPTWEAVVEITSKETQLAHALKSAISPIEAAAGYATAAGDYGAAGGQRGG